MKINDIYIDNYRTLESMSQAIWYNSWTLKKFSRFLHGDILEVGCGFGSFTKTLVDYGKLWAFDNDPECTAKTKSIMGDKAVVFPGDIVSKYNQIQRKKFDAIVCMNVLEHIKNDKKAISNMTELLKKNGHLILLVPIGQGLYGSIDESIHHFRRYDKKSLTGYLKKQGLHIVFSRKLNFFGAIGWFVAGKILKTKIVKKNQLLMFNLFAPFLLQLENLIEPPFGTSVLIVARK